MHYSQCHMITRVLIIWFFIIISFPCCFATEQQARSNEVYSKSSFDKILQDNQQLKQELFNIKDSLRSVSIFNRAVEQSNKEKQLEIEQHFQQKQEALQYKEQEISAMHGKQRFLLLLLVVGICVCLLLLIYLFLLVKNQINKSTEASSFVPVLESNFNQKFIIENITAQIEAQETERERISRELHDGIGGNLVAIRLLLQSVDIDNPIINELQRLVANTQQEIRAISHNLAPPRLDEIPFEQLFLHHIGHIKATTSIGIEGILLPQQGWGKLSIKLQTEIFRLVQELTGNIVKHSKSTKASISLRLEEKNVSVLAEDNGIGFIVEKGYEGIGLQNLKLRVAYLNGTIDINSTPGKGTIVMIEIPINELNTTKNDEA